jgi:hypothetical protein
MSDKGLITAVENLRITASTRIIRMKGRWERGREVMNQSLEFMRAAKYEQALSLLDNAIAEAVQEQRHLWVPTLCGHAAVISHQMGDRRREIHYNQLRLPLAKDYAFAAYNFAQLLLSDGQVAVPNNTPPRHTSSALQKKRKPSVI